MDADLALLSTRIGEALRERSLTLTTAESCTGGWAAQIVTHTAGSSGWFDRGFRDVRNPEPIEAARRWSGQSRAILRLERAVVAGTKVNSGRDRMSDVVLHLLWQLIGIGDEIHIAPFVWTASAHRGKSIGLVAAGGGAYDHPGDADRLIRCGGRG